MTLFLPRLPEDELPDSPATDSAPVSPPPPEPPRVRRVVESLLENEALTDGLDDDAASVLLDWGITLAKEIAASTAGMDDEAAEQAMYPRLRALRKMMRRIRRWAVAPESRKLEKIIAQAETAYGPGYEAPGAGEREAFSRQFAVGAWNPAHAISQLRRFIEHRNPSQTQESSPST